MSKFWSIPFFMAVLVFVSGTTVPIAHAQTLASSAAFSGSVTDPSGARVANASVTLGSAEKGITRTFKTNDEGNFSFSLLPAGTYVLTVEAAGFKTFKQQALTLEVGQSASEDVPLTIGSTEQILVTEAAPLLQTDNANIGQEVSTKQVTELPLNLRNVFNFVQLNSSVNNNSQQQVLQGGGEQGTADQDVSFFNFGGGFFGTTAFLLDGAWDSIGSWGGVIYVPSPDNVQEFKVQQNSFTAQYGWSTGNVINVVTKSGGNSLHGVGYEYLRNGKLDANSYTNRVGNLPKPNSHRNQFGLRLGGRFTSRVSTTSAIRLSSFSTTRAIGKMTLLSTVSIVPTTDFRNGDFSAQLGANVDADALWRPVLAGQIYDPYTTRQVNATCAVPNADPTRPSPWAAGWIRDPIAGNNLANAVNGIDPVGQALVNFYPQPNTNTVLETGLPQALAATTPTNISARIDHNFSDKHPPVRAVLVQEGIQRCFAGLFWLRQSRGPGTKKPQ